MNPNQIELLAVNAVEDFFAKIKRINPMIPLADKEPSWDGFLYLYSDDSMKKDSLIGRIPIQVKGKQGEFVESLSYPVKTSDLRNYMREGGCIYFVVLINDKQERKIFHRMLTPVELQNILKGHEQQKSINVKMKPLDGRDDDVYHSLVDFYRDMKKQTGSPIKTLSLKDLVDGNYDTFRFSLSGFDASKESLESFITRKAICLYVKPMDANASDIPIKEGRCFLKLIQNVKQAVSVNGIVFYNSFEKTNEKNKIILGIGHCLKVAFDSQNPIEMSVNIKLEATELKAMVQDIRFVLAAIENKSFKIGDYQVDIPSNNESKKLCALLKGEYARLQRVEILLERLHVIKNLDLSTMQNVDWETLKILTTGILDEKELTLNVKESRLYNIKVGNLMFLLLVCQQKSGKFRIFDYFTPPSALKLISPEGYEASKYAVLEVDGYVRYDNIDFSNILPSISALKAKHDCFLDYAKYEVFNMLKACGKLDDDKEKRTILLNMSSDIIDWMIEETKDADEKQAYECYAYLVKFLKNSLTEEDIATLNGILYSDKVDDPLKASVALLLKNKSAFDVFYSKMTKDEKENFKKLPFSEIML